MEVGLHRYTVRFTGITATVGIIKEIMVVYAAKEKNDQCKAGFQVGNGKERRIGKS